MADSKFPNQPLKVVDNVVDRPYRVHRLVERPVERVIDKPVTLERVIERLVVDTVDKVVDKPACRRESDDRSDLREQCGR
jgi:hypothetical protein